ncbi:murein biosynthesis integral membrane protein MurJ [bacterium]|nr:murein biosynthesis integral membrane protein MurJ [bacterium]
MQTNTDSDKNSTTILKAAWLIAVVTVVSKLVGFFRDIIVANYYGASTVSDAYFYAYQFPALAVTLLGGIGGPFHSATVAVFTKLIPNLKEKPPEVAEKLFNTFLTASFIFFTILTVILFLFSNQIMSLIISDGSAELVNLAALHLRIMCPSMIIGGLIGIYYGILISYKEFMLPSLSPIVVSVVIIGALLFTGGDKSGVVLATATVVGALCQLLLQMPKVRMLGYKIRPNFDITNNPNFKSILELLFPAVLSSTIGQVHIYIDMFFSSCLEEGAWTAIGFANRVFQFPVGILVTAFLVPLFPLFSRLAGEKDFDGIKTYFNKGVGVLFFAAIPIIIGILTLGYDGVKIVFERGAFNDNATFMVTQALWFLSFSILPYVFRDSITRVYYSFNDSATPFYVAFSSIVLKVLFNYILVKKLMLGIGGITLSTSLVTLFNATVLGILISRKIKLNYKELFINLFKMCVAGVITLIICYFTSKYLHAHELIRIAVIGILCLTIYTGLNLAMKMEYAGELAKRLTERFKR